MPDYVIYHMPGSCSRVSLQALEEIDRPYLDRGVALMRGEQRSPPFLAINPKGKVPVLIAGDLTITETPVILYRLALANPEADLLPKDSDGAISLGALADLIWIAGALHPLANRIFMPASVSNIDPDGVKRKAIELLAAQADTISARLATRRWWYGDRWSIADAFLAWVFDIASQSGFPLADYPLLEAHRRHVEARPSYTRARARERAAVARDGLTLPPGIAA